MCAFYDGTKLLSMKDLNGNQPELYLVVGNRTGGKTTYYNRLAINRFKKKTIRKFALLYRYNYELDGVETKFFKDIKELFFPSDEMTSKNRAGGVYKELFLNDEPCGYAISLNSADQIKKYSHVFNDVDMIIFDEFQPESNQYCTGEIKKFISVHTSIARGQGEQVREVPVYMLSNAVTILNPYFIKLGISSRLMPDTKILRGDGFILEQAYVESASEAQRNSAFNRAFSSDEYVAYSGENKYLIDNQAFVDKPSGVGRYFATIRYKGCDFALREFIEQGLIYCDDRPDKTFPFKITVTTDDHNINYLMLKSNDMFLQNLRYFFEKGCFRFKDLRCKDAVLNMLSY